MKPKLFLIILLINACAVIKAQDLLPCESFCVTNVIMDTDTSLKVTVFMKGAGLFIDYPCVHTITDTNGDTIATGVVDYYGQLGETFQGYTLKTKLTSLPANFKGTMHFSYYYMPDDNSLLKKRCPLPYPCLSTKVENTIFSNEIKIYPVPLNAASSLHIDGNIPTNAYFRVFDLTGREVEQKPIANSTLQLDKNNLPEGMYMYVIDDNKTIFKTGKLVVSYQMEQ